MTEVGHFMNDDQVVLGVHCRLNVVSNDAGAATASGHRTGIGVCERDLMIRCSFHLLTDLAQTLHLFFDAADLLLESRHTAFAHRARFPIGTIKLGQVASYAL